MGKHPFLKKLRGQFTTGLIILIPIIITIFLVSWFFRALDGILGRYFAHLFGQYVYGVGFLSLFLLIWLVGIAGRTYIGARLNNFKDFMIFRIPMVGSVFSAVKKVSDGFLEVEAGNFEQVVLIEYPRKGIYAVAFVTSRQEADLIDSGKSRSEAIPLVHVFVPTVPNPTSGYLLLVPENEIQYLNLTVEEGLKLVLSLGMIHPPEYYLRSKFPSAAQATLTGAESYPSADKDKIPPENA